MVNPPTGGFRILGYLNPIRVKPADAYFNGNSFSFIRKRFSFDGREKNKEESDCDTPFSHHVRRDVSIKAEIDSSFDIFATHKEGVKEIVCVFY